MREGKRKYLCVFMHMCVLGKGLDEQRHGDGRTQMEVALDRWGRLWAECGSGDVARKGCAMEKCRLYLLRFVPEYEKNFLISHGG